jgi:uncharacterized protein YegL
MQPQTKRKLQLIIGFTIFGIATIASYFSVIESSGEKYDVYLVLDVSGSMAQPVEMGGHSKLESAKEASIRFLQAVCLGSNPNVKVGLITFSTNIYVESHLTSDPSILFGKIQGLSPQAETSVGDAIQKGVDILIQEGEVSSKWVIVVMTDGNSNADHVVSNDPMIAPLLAADHGNQSHIVVHAVAFGNDANLEMCQEIAKRGGGQYFFAATGDDLVAAFVGIASSFVSPVIHYVARILMLIAIPLILFLPEIEKGATTIFKAISTTLYKKPGVQCLECGGFNERQSKFCRHCGKPVGALGKPCPRCKHMNSDKAKFCSRCGASLR